MPTRDEHLSQASHNVDFYATINKPEYKDWAITVLFYIGLHYIDAVLALNNIHPASHPTRDSAVGASQELRRIYGHYQTLKNQSYNARYKPPTLFTSGQITELETKHLAAVKAEAGLYVPIGS